MKHLLSLIALRARAAIVFALVVFLIASVQQLDESDVARAGGFWSTR